MVPTTGSLCHLAGGSLKTVTRLVPFCISRSALDCLRVLLLGALVTYSDCGGLLRGQGWEEAPQQKKEREP